MGCPASAGRKRILAELTIERHSRFAVTNLGRKYGFKLKLYLDYLHVGCLSIQTQKLLSTEYAVCSCWSFTTLKKQILQKKSKSKSNLQNIINVIILPFCNQFKKLVKWVQIESLHPLFPQENWHVPEGIACMQYISPKFKFLL